MFLYVSKTTLHLSSSSLSLAEGLNPSSIGGSIFHIIGGSETNLHHDCSHIKGSLFRFPDLWQSAGAGQFSAANHQSNPESD
mmetsp:Transcript_22809/g.29106  ORF Transcript_22809/g.29106 Transcript_22809/m.29106 type:complete len:82 (-) Transcript_22809:191-436(-)